MSALTVAVIGLGYFSQFHLRGWAAQPGVTLVGVTDTSPVRRAEAAAAGLPVFASAAELLAQNPDIVDIVTPPASHAALVRAALRPGRLIIAQKPFCGAFAPAAEVAREAEAAGTSVAVHENFRFQPWHREARRLIDAGAIGQPWQCSFRFRPGDGRGPEAYLSRQPVFQQMERFLIYEAGVHFLDLFRYLFGEITSVYAQIRRLNPAIRGEDDALFVLVHQGGLRAIFDGNRLSDHITDSPRRTMGEMLIEGEGGSLRLDGSGQLYLRAFGAQDERAVFTPEPDPEFGGGCVARLIAHLVSHLREGTPLENRVQDYLPVLRASEAAYRSAAGGGRIDLTGDAA